MSNNTKLTPRQLAAVEALAQNPTHSQVAASLNVSRQRASKMLKSAKANAAIPAWMAPLGLRLSRTLITRGFGDPDKLKAALLAGERISRVGAGSRRLLAECLGIGLPEPK